MIKKIFIISLLTMVSLYAQKNYKGAEYRTKEAYKYGRFETKLKSMEKDGTLSTLFTYFEQTSEDRFWNEIDVEILGRYSNEVQFNTILNSSAGNHVRHEWVDFNPADDYHEYAFEWTPDYVAWFIDNKEVYRQTGDFIKQLTRPQKIMMNVWLPAYTNWVGEFKEEHLPGFAYYDWVKYYSYKPGAGNSGTNNNFNFEWADEFNTFDENRWQKATHTWDGNNVNMTPENAVIKDGKLILCITDNNNLGYIDRKPPVIHSARQQNGKVFMRFSEEVDRASAELKENYIIPGVTINSVTLLPDSKRVLLDVTGLRKDVVYTIIIRNIKDLFGNFDTKSGRVEVENQLPFPIKIDVGGSGNSEFLPDQYFDNSKEYGYYDGTKAMASGTLEIANTDLDHIYRSETYYLPNYIVRVPKGKYNIKLMFAESYFTEKGKRIFDVLINHKLIYDNLDIFEKVGKNAAFDIDVKDFQVDTNYIEIQFASEIENTVLNGIIIEEANPSSVEEASILPSEFQLYQNFPNPFNGETVINYYLPDQDNLNFFVYDLLGREVYYHEIGDVNAGSHSVKWNAINKFGGKVSSGVYFYSIKGNNISAVQKLMLLN